MGPKRTYHYTYFIKQILRLPAPRKILSKNFGTNFSTSLSLNTWKWYRYHITKCWDISHLKSNSTFNFFSNSFFLLLPLTPITFHIKSICGFLLFSDCVHPSYRNNENQMVGGHSFSTHKKFSKKSNISYPPGTYTSVCVSRVKKCCFFGAYVLDDKSAFLVSFECILNSSYICYKLSYMIHRHTSDFIHWN